MKHYRVKALSVGAKSNKIFSAGDIVPEDAFAVSADELVGKGFLEECVDSEKVVSSAIEHQSIGQAKGQPTSKKKSTAK